MSVYVSSSIVRVSCLTLIGTTIVLGFAHGPSWSISSERPITKPLSALHESSPISSSSHAVDSTPTTPAGRVASSQPLSSDRESPENSTRAGFLRRLMSSAALACTAGVMVGGGSATSAAVASDGSATYRSPHAFSRKTAAATCRNLAQDELFRHQHQRAQTDQYFPPRTVAKGDSPLVIARDGTTESTSESALSGLVAGAAVSTAKQLLLYPVDTVKTRLQVKRDGVGGEAQDLFRGLYDGVLTPLVVGAPSGAVFFAAKDSFSTAISNTLGSGYADWITVVAVGLAQIPYWGIRSPGDLLKTRSQAGLLTDPGGGVAAAKEIVANEGVQGLYTGYTSNVAYAFPADAIKFLVYGALKRSAKKAKGGEKLGTIEAAVLGSGASMVAQAVTTPLDVVRTRVMVASGDDRRYEGGIAGALTTIAREEGSGALFKGTTPRVARSVLSGAIQFGSYEFVKGLFGVEPRKL